MSLDSDWSVPSSLLSLFHPSLWWFSSRAIQDPTVTAWYDHSIRDNFQPKHEVRAICMHASICTMLAFPISANGFASTASKSTGTVMEPNRITVNTIYSTWCYIRLAKAPVAILLITNHLINWSKVCCFDQRTDVCCSNFVTSRFQRTRSVSQQCSSPHQRSGISIAR